MLATELQSGTFDFDTWLAQNIQNIYKNALDFVEETPQDGYDSIEDYMFEKALYIGICLVEENDPDAKIFQSKEFETFVNCLYTFLGLEQLKKQGLLNRILDNGVIKYSKKQ